MSSHHRANAFEPALSSGVWEGLSYRQGCEGVDETRWTQTSLVFTDIRKGGVGRLTPRGEAPAWGREEPGSAIFRLCGKGISHWRGRQIHFALRGFVEPGGGGGGADQQLMRITLIKRHLGEYSNVVQYEGTLSQNGSSIQGKFADGLFQLRQVDPASHVLARELTGAWDGESSCRRGGQSNTRWKSVRLVFQPLPPGDGRGWGLLITGGGDSIWNEQRIPFCVSGRLSLPGLEVELEKQHLEGYHNRIAYFGRVLPGGSGDKIMDGPAADDPPPPTRLIGVYEHGDFFLHRNPKFDLDSSGRPLPGGSSSSSSSTNRAVGSGGGGSSTTGGRLAGGGRTGEKSVLEACIDLFRRSADNPSVWSKAAGLYRPTLVPPMARSHSGDGLRGGPGTPVIFGQKQQQQQQQQQQQKGLQAPSSSPPPQQHQHQPTMRVMPTNSGGGRGGEGAGLGQAAGKLVVRKHVGGVAGPSTSYAWRGEEGDGQVDGRVSRVDAGPRVSTRFVEGGGAGGGGGNDRQHPQQHPPPRGAVTTRTHYPSPLPPMYEPVGRRSGGSSGGGGGDFDDREGAEGGGLAWDLKAPSQVWEQQHQQHQQVYQRPHEPNGSSNSNSNGRPGRSDKASEMQAAAAAWNNLGFGSGDLVAANGGGGGGREFRAGMPLPTSDHNGAGGWKGMFDDVTRQAGETAADARSSAVDAVGVMAVSNGGGDVQPLFARAAGTRKTLEFPAMPPAAGGGGGGDWDEAAAVAAFMNSDGGGGRGGGGTGRMAAGDGGGSANGAPQGQSVAANGHGHGAFHYRHTMHHNGGDTSSSSTTSSPSSTSNASSSGSGCNKVVGAPTANAAATAAGRTGLDDMQFLRSSLSDSSAGGDGRGAAATVASAASSLHQRDVDNVGAGAGSASQYSPAKNAADSGAPAPGLAPLATVSSAGTAAPAAAAASSGVGDGDDDERSTTRKPADGSGGGGGGSRQEEERCKICHMGSVDALLLPCGHLCACHSCASVLVVCPICRADIYRVQPVYRS